MPYTYIWQSSVLCKKKNFCATSVHVTESIGRQKHSSLMPSPSFFCPVYWISQHSKLITHLNLVLSKAWSLTPMHGIHPHVLTFRQRVLEWWSFIHYCNFNHKIVYLKDVVGVVDQAVVTSHQHHNWTPINHLSPFAMIQAGSLQKLFYTFPLYVLYMYQSNTQFTYATLFVPCSFYRNRSTLQNPPKM